MRKQVVTLTPNHNLLEAQRLMQQHGIARVVVVENARRPVGVVTRKDLVGFVLADPFQRAVDEISLREVMSKPPVLVGRTASVQYCARLMTLKGISSLIVVDNRKKLTGLVTKTDLCAHSALHGKGLYRVEQFMTKRVHTRGPPRRIRSNTGKEAELRSTPLRATPRPIH